jgi:hypothetical protein
MTDVAPASAGDTGAAAPVAPAASPVAIETLHESASNKFATLMASRDWRGRVLARDPAAVNERQTLLQILHGTGDDESKTALAKSIGLEQKATLAAADQQRQAAADANADLAPNLGQWARAVGPQAAAQETAILTDWARSLPLSPETAKSLLQHVADTGNQMIPRTEAQRLTWLEDEDRILLGTARGDRRQVDVWRAQAAKALAGSKMNLDNSILLNSAYAIRTLANAGANLK